MKAQFKQFEEFIRRSRIKLADQKYIEGSAEGRELVRLCDGHASYHTSGTIGEANIVAVHPFFRAPFFGHPPREIERLVYLLRNADREMFGRVLFETYLDYPTISHELVEEGIIDRVFFTVPRHSNPVRPEDMKGFAGSQKNYVGGCYGDACVKRVMRRIRQNAPPNSVTPISDAILFHSMVYDDGKGYEQHTRYINRLFSQYGGGIMSSALLETQYRYKKAA